MVSLGQNRFHQQRRGNNLPSVVYFLLLLGELWPSYLLPSHCLVEKVGRDKF